jgi:putative FmdB family regulatory protein
MPTYEYVCEKCGHKFDQSQSMSAKPLAVCPEQVCPQRRWGKGTVKRAISGGAGIIFKGSGFYVTDYRSDKYKEAAKKDSAAAAPASTSTDKKGAADSAKPAKSEAKPASTKN